MRRRRRVWYWVEDFNPAGGVWWVTAYGQRPRYVTPDEIDIDAMRAAGQRYRLTSSRHFANKAQAMRAVRQIADIGGVPRLTKWYRKNGQRYCRCYFLHGLNPTKPRPAGFRVSQVSIGEANGADVKCEVPRV